MSPWFHTFAQRASRASGAPAMFWGSCVALLAWLLAGPFLRWSQLWWDMPTNILTWTTWFVLILVKRTQDTDQQATGAKQDEVIRAVKEARNTFIGLEQRSPEEIAQAQADVAMQAQRQE